MNDNDMRYEEYIGLCKARFRKLYGSDYPSPEEYALMPESERHKIWAASLSTRWFEDFKRTIDGITDLTDLTRVEAMMVFFGAEMMAAKNWITSLTPHNEDEHKEPWQQ